MTGTTHRVTPALGRDTGIKLCTFAVLFLLATPAHAIGTKGGPAFTIEPNPGDPFFAPYGVAIDPVHDLVIIADTGHNRLMAIPRSQALEHPTWQLLWADTDEGDNDADNLGIPCAVTVDDQGRIYATDNRFDHVRRFVLDESTGQWAWDPTFIDQPDLNHQGKYFIGGLRTLNTRDVDIGPDGRVYVIDDRGRILVADTDGPGSHRFTIWREHPSWFHAYGIDVVADASGDPVVWLANTYRSEILRIPESPGTIQKVIGYAKRPSLGGVNYPRDVAVGPDGLLYIADTYNFRIVAFDQSGQFHHLHAIRPAVIWPEKIEFDEDGGLWTVDSAAPTNETVVYLPGPDAAPGYDLYLRDALVDDGSGDLPTSEVLDSPDIIVRHEAIPRDEFKAVKSTGPFDAYPSQAPRYDADNYVYVLVRNRGEFESTYSNLHLYRTWAGSGLDFPADWDGSPFFGHTFTKGPFGAGVPDNSLKLGRIPPCVPGPDGCEDGFRLVGPIIWRPKPPGGDIANLVSSVDRYLLAVITDPFDQPKPYEGLDFARRNNNVTARRFEISAGPFDDGVQQALVVMANYAPSELVSEPFDPAAIEQQAGELDTWVQAASFGKLEVAAGVVGPVQLDHPHSWYHQPSNNPAMELVEEVAAKLLLVDPGAFDQGTEDTSDDYHRVIVVTDSDTADGHMWSTPGDWTYDIGGMKWGLSASVHGPDVDEVALRHGSLHHFGFRDLHHAEDSPVVLPEGRMLPVGYDVMMWPPEPVLPMTFATHDAGWLTKKLHFGVWKDQEVLFLPRPGPGESPTSSLAEVPFLSDIVERHFVGYFNESVGVALGLTPGVTDFEDERRFYWIESRSPATGYGDELVPVEGPVIYYVNLDLESGDAPVRVVDQDPEEPGLQAAIVPPALPFEVEVPEIGLTVTLEELVEGPNNVLTRWLLDIDYAGPAAGVDLAVRKGKPSWTSPDIWVEPLEAGVDPNAFDEQLGLEPKPGDDVAIAFHDNRIYARVHNFGPDTAVDVAVHFWLSEPNAGVGKAGYQLRRSLVIEEILPDEYADVWMLWKPEPTDETDEDGEFLHSCVKVVVLPADIAGLSGVDPSESVLDPEPSNNTQNQNIKTVESAHASPYEPVRVGFHITHGEDEPAVYYLRADNIPEDWSWSLTPSKAFLQPGERIDGELEVQPSEVTADCTDHEVHVTAWTPRADTLVLTGGVTLHVDLRQRTEIVVTALEAACTSAERALLATMLETFDLTLSPCQTIRVTGHTEPARPDAELKVRFRGVGGNPLYVTTMTDSGGHFQAELPVAEGGLWDVTAIFTGDECAGSARETVPVQVTLPQTGDTDGDGVDDVDEPDGDIDGDSVVDFMDPDADGDGLLDGEDCTPYGPGIDELVLPVEVCNGVDDDCDGEVDEPWTELGTACDGPDADLCPSGVRVCSPDGTTTVCEEAGPGLVEVCNGQDDDCDGLVDGADPDLGGNDAPACELTQGVCGGVTKPVALCSEGLWLPCSAAVYAGAVAAAFEPGMDLAGRWRRHLAGRLAALSQRFDTTVRRGPAIPRAAWAVRAMGRRRRSRSRVPYR